MLDKKECIALGSVLQKMRTALREKNSRELKQLSDELISEACARQDALTITLAVISYTLGKLIERSDYIKIKNWDKVERKLLTYLELAESSVENKQEKCEVYVRKMREILSQQSAHMRNYIEDILRKAAINKGARLYEQGLSLSKTASLLGISIWELAEYIGSQQLKKSEEVKHKTMSEKERIKMLVDFFEGS
ncbi:hypothetical protein D6817_03315 [Candidatus Pacearchaeota archaeon]|nr:MAG: hypothetical protein D6817_03315 [Candidatus Pacearchaeota archaeon]